MALKEKVEETLRHLEGFKDAQISLETTMTGSVGGFVVSGVFNDMPHLDRQDLLWDQLEKKLTADEARMIVSLVALSPDEATEDDEDTGNDSPEAAAPAK